MLEVTATALEGVKIVKPPKFGDQRGFFSEVYSLSAMAKLGIETIFVQDNQSLSATPGTIRGLHYQSPPFAQAKLVRVVKGAILDVAVDIRRASPTFGHHVAVELSAENWTQLLVPVGFAHGFVTLAPDTEVIYKVSAPYSAQHDRGLAFDDPDLGIDWTVDLAKAVLSDKDRKHPRLADLPGRVLMAEAQRMRLVVTGQNGQVARSLSRQCRDIMVIPVGRPGFDLENIGTVEPGLKALAPDVIVNAAAYTAVDKAEDDEARCRLVNAAGAQAVAEAAATLRVPLIQISTDYVYDGQSDHPYREDDPIAPLGAYGRSKAEGERAASTAQPDSAVLRTAWVYSPFGANFVKTMLRLGETRDTISVVADQRGSPTSALDMADAILSIAARLVQARDDRTLRGVFHVSGTGDTNWAHFAEVVFDEAERHGRRPVNVVHITSDQYPTRARRPANSVLDGAKLERVFGLTLPHWEKSVRDCVKELLSVQNGERQA